MIHPGRTVILISIRLALGGVFSIAAEPQGPSSQNAAPVRIGSKLSTDSVILAEIATQLARSAGAPADHLRQLGGSEVLFKALLRGDIDLYPEYTGTLIEELLHDPGIQTDSQIRAALSGQGIGMTGPLGFSNNYAIGMGAERAETLHIATLSDLRARPELKFGFSNEFMDRHDGWPLLRSRYGLPQTSVRGLDHDLAYRALADGSIDATDLYSADAEIAYYHLRVLTDDLHVFPQYRAVYLYRLNLAVKWPAVAAAMEKMAGQIDESRMISMSEQAKLERIPEATVAAHFLQSALAISGYGRVSGFWRTLGRRTVEHLYLVCISLAAAIVVAVPLGVISARIPVLGRFILGGVAAIYTIPSLALLAFMIPLMGIGARPAIVALFLYSLLPIVRNTHAGLRAISPAIRESAQVLGLPPRVRLIRIELPMASASILSGIQTSAVINVGTATLGALIGAGGYGEPILTGIRLDSTGLILSGAIPAALLALLVQGLFELLERFLVPRGLRLKTESVR